MVSVYGCLLFKYENLSVGHSTNTKARYGHTCASNPRGEGDKVIPRHGGYQPSSKFSESPEIRGIRWNMVAHDIQGPLLASAHRCTCTHSYTLTHKLRENSIDTLR